MTKEYKYLEPPWGLECDDGWDWLILDMFHKIEIELNKKQLKDFAITQIKEKYGGLRVYTVCSNQVIDNIIEKYKKKSFHICEICGRRGKLRVRYGWYKTLCRKHYKKWTKD